MFDVRTVFGKDRVNDIAELTGNRAEAGTMVFAFGTLAPIMRDRHLMGTPVGRAVSVYGAYGELLPILAMALLMSTRSTRATIATLLIFVAICLAILAFPALLPRVRERIDSWLKENAWSGSRPLLRLSILLLSVLVMACEVLDLEPVLGSFIAGFILGAFAPHDHVLEEKLQDIGNGFLVPAYFVISGAGVSLPAAFENVGLLFGFIGLLVLIRGGIVAVSLNINKETRGMRKREKYAVSAYCTMALPLVVAVTDVAVESGAMGTNTASILVSAGAITVLLIPIATSFVRVGAESDVFSAVHEVAAEKLPIQNVMRSILIANSNLLNAALNVDMAEAQLKAAKLAFLPGFSFTPQGTIASWDYSKASKTYSLPVSASWDANLFGNLTAAKRSTQMALLQAKDYQVAVQTKLVANVANMYYTLLMLDKQLQIIDDMETLTKDTWDIMKVQHESVAGVRSTAVQSAEANYLSVKTQKEDLKRQVRETENSLSLLLGEAAQAIPRGTLDAQSLPSSFATGVGIQLLNNRADVHANEMALAECFYNVEDTKRLMASAGSTYLEVITAESNLLNSQLNKVSDDFNKMQAVVNLYYALGGGAK